MSSFGFEEMQQIQKELQGKYKQWGGLPPEKGQEKLLWAYAEMGEVADIIKKNSCEDILNNGEAREHFIEEVCDVMMYLNDVLLCYEISPEEIENIYKETHRRNMERW